MPHLFFLNDTHPVDISPGGYHGKTNSASALVTEASITAMKLSIWVATLHYRPRSELIKLPNQEHGVRTPLEPIRAALLCNIIMGITINTHVNPTCLPNSGLD